MGTPYWPAWWRRSWNRKSGMEMDNEDRQKTAMGTVGGGVWSQRDRRSPWSWDDGASPACPLGSIFGTWQLEWSIHIKRLGENWLYCGTPTKSFSLSVSLCMKVCLLHWSEGCVRHAEHSICLYWAIAKWYRCYYFHYCCLEFRTFKSLF